MGIIIFLSASNWVNRFWVLYSLIGFFVGGILWTYSFIILVKKLPKIPSHLKVQLLFGTLPLLTSTTYGVTMYFKYFIIGSILCFFLLGVVATYWYGQPSERSVTLVISAVKFFGVLLIVFAQMDHWPSLIFLLIFLAFCSSFSYCVSTYESVQRLSSLLVQITCKSVGNVQKKWKPKPKLLKFPFISKQQFELQYLNTPTYLYEISSAVKADPLLIRKIKKSNRALVALFCLDPDGYSLLKSDDSCDDEHFSDDSDSSSSIHEDNEFSMNLNNDSILLLD